MKKVFTLIVCMSAFGCLCEAATELTYVDLVKKLYDLKALAELPLAGERCLQFSSYDRRSRFDEATGEYLGWEANSDGGGFVRREGDDYVMAEMDGPGVIWRIWSALAGEGHVRIYLDGAEAPAVDLPFRAYFDGTAEPFTRESLVHEAAKGLNCYVPIPFQESCKIVAEKDWGRYYHFTYSVFGEGTQVPTFTRELSAAEVAALDRADDILTNGDRAVRSHGKKADTVTVGPSETVRVFERDKAGAITEFKAKVDLPEGVDERKALGGLWLRIYWDGETHPSVFCPLGDFFGTAPGKNVYASLPLSVTDEWSWCRWYMPYEEARVELVNEGGMERKVRFEIKYAPVGAEVKGLGRFHAWWHRDVDLDEARKIDWTMLKAEGRGRYCGVMLHVWNPKGGWWGEGDEKFFVDGEKFPSTFGTGSEDYFGYAWCCPDLFENCFHNQTISEGNVGHISVNRWHIADNVPFQESFEGAIEKYYPNSRPTLYSCVAYWYQAEPHREWELDAEAALKRDKDLEMFVFFQRAMEVEAGDAVEAVERLRRTYKELKGHAEKRGYGDALNLRMARVEKMAGNEEKAVSIITPSLESLTEPFVERIKAPDLWAVLPVGARGEESFKPYLTDNEDGSTKRVMKEGRWCITTRGEERRPCIYFAMPDEADFRNKDRTALITVTYYYDGRRGSLFQLQYDSYYGEELRDMYMPAKKNAAPLAAGWHTVTIECPRARFIGRQNARSDFRLISQGEGELFVSDIRVRLEE